LRGDPANAADDDRSKRGRDLHHISTTRDGKNGAVTVAHGFPNLAADLPKDTNVLLGSITSDTLPR
jgi:hypothetical protein